MAVLPPSRRRLTLLLMAGCFLLQALSAHAITRHYKFNVVMRNMTRLCSTKPVLTVNGKFPGPTLYAREGDNVLVKVVNHVANNVTIHWHGVRQIRTGWYDGPAYITQCPIQPGSSFLYNFTITGQRGTLLWHAHINWLRATIHGAIVILPKLGVPYPFPAPHKEDVIVLGEWWKEDTENVINQAMQLGVGPNISDSHTINGHPGPLSECASSQDGFKLKVENGKTYMLRIINAALNDDLFFKVAGHELTVVEVDAVYTKPFTTDTLLITPGQTTSVLLRANQSAGRYLLSVSPFMDSPLQVDNKTGTATLHYANTVSSSMAAPLILIKLPPQNATSIVSKFADRLHSLNSKEYPANVPQTIDHSLLLTVGVGVNPCPSCINGTRVVGTINNVTFIMPSTPILQAYYYNIPGVFTQDFPATPLHKFNYTGSGPKNLQTMNGTRVYRLPYNASVQVVLQDTGIISPESHPIHLHGFNFFVVGRGVGNYNPKTSPSTFNLIDPIERNTVGVPTGGWTAIRFRADNPGVWFMHCHFEVHTSWGLKMVFVVDNGKRPSETLIPPPKDLPHC
ncbi:laccase-22 [Oryza brachyantha]|uniref:Laccase n=1 Tax=Oryza brachyantha TaxID=4533 RepID=J3NAI6_ORYBR|nr:laccase-22 [Oryza brachyantha]